ncbi:hypothetical protein ETAA8_45650 [Anatilimnocola aggregata]|uniref:Uncharacterized protein n=1 Tax=Anatilimnocola aggregata TaxID=2528021 RepID=A0A517YGU6_9BACT|nr:hypothetical protein [Anatilimnocola aggregata]QDU29455.1 hypothetical protein ETAA8_45650 [Anatilimnocola aggregata]
MKDELINGRPVTMRAFPNHWQLLVKIDGATQWVRAIKDSFVQRHGEKKAHALVKQNENFPPITVDDDLAQVYRNGVLIGVRSGKVAKG